MKLDSTLKCLLEQRNVLLDIASNAAKKIEDPEWSCFYKDKIEALMRADEHYYCWREGCELITKSKDEVTEWISSDCGTYEVLDSFGRSVDEFIPF